MLQQIEIQHLRQQHFQQLYSNLQRPNDAWNHMEAC